MRQSLKKTRSLLLIGLPALLLACGDSTSPSGLTPAGNYHATLFVTTSSSGQTNQLQVGGYLLINLAANGTTSGHLHVAGTGGAAPFDADLTGTWTKNGNVVDFTQVADSFVRDMLFTFGPDASGYFSLAGDQVFSGTRIQILLSQAPIPA